MVGIFLLLAIMFLVFQYQRETEYKVDILHNRLQVVNYQAEEAWPDTLSILPANCRLTVLSTDGKVLYDNEKPAAQMTNHIDRKEIKLALDKGTGYDIQRKSETVDEKFFYSATFFKEKGLIVRSALPYDSQLYKELTIDKTFVYFILGITIALCLVLYQIARRLALSERHRVEGEKQQLKRQLTQNAAHELKTPTASISVYIETMLNDPNLPEETRQHFLERSFVQCKRMTNILSDMSALAKMDAVEQVKEPMRIDARQLLEDISSDVQLALKEAQMEMKINLDNITILGDRSLIYSVFRNLVDNAIAYAGKGSETDALRITVSATQINSEMVEFFVSDNGVGVPREHLPHLCERFYRIDKSRSRKLGGTGLGLAIVKNAILLHGGEIDLMPTPGGGLTVRLTLPAPTL